MKHGVGALLQDVQRSSQCQQHASAQEHFHRYIWQILYNVSVHLLIFLQRYTAYSDDTAGHRYIKHILASEKGDTSDSQWGPFEPENNQALNMSLGRFLYRHEKLEQTSGHILA